MRGAGSQAAASKGPQDSAKRMSRSAMHLQVSGESSTCAYRPTPCDMHSVREAVTIHAQTAHCRWWREI
jgi:hypothetical protein